jgi:hypothetical protein
MMDVAPSSQAHADARQWLRCNCNLTCNIVSVTRQQGDLPRFQMLQDSVTSMYSSKTLGEQLVFTAAVLTCLYQLIFCKTAMTAAAAGTLCMYVFLNTLFYC